MKKTLFSLLTASLLLTACSGGSDDNGGRQEDKPKVYNANANDASVRKEYARLEFPCINTAEGNYVLIHTTAAGVNYSTEWNAIRKTQRWSCYEMYRSNLEQHTSRYYSNENQYPDDPLLDLSLQWGSGDPYWRSGYDHGHICPSADRLASKEENIQTFYKTNMQPQFNGFNAGVWANMEMAVRQKAKQNMGTSMAWCDTLYVCRGGTVDEGSYGDLKHVYTTTGKGLLVPRFFWMALLRVKDGQYNAIGLWIDQYQYRTSKESKLAQFCISIDELERRTGLDFFCNLPNEREERVESIFAPILWGFE